MTTSNADGHAGKSTCILKSEVTLPFVSPSAFFASLQTSTIHVDYYRTNGAAMALIKKRDVESYFAERKRRGVQLFRSTSQPDATGFSGKDTAIVGVESKPPAQEPIPLPLDGEVKIPATAPAPSDFLGQTPDGNVQS
jgi:hypothetical protein